jgi:hypothetical protein
VTTLELAFCGMEAPPTDPLAIATALQYKTSIQRMELRQLDEIYTIPIVSSLAYNITVQELVLDCQNSLDLSLAVRSLLESTAVIQKFELFLRGGVEEDTFLPIAQGLINNTSVTDIKFDRCRFDGQEEALMLKSILESKSNLHSLNFHWCRVNEETLAEFRAAILSHLQPHSLLRSFELQGGGWDVSEVFETSQDFNQLLAAIEMSSLEIFSIGTIFEREYCLELIQSIPKMKIQTLEFVLDGGLWDLKGGILQAIKQNASLHPVFGGAFDAEDEMALVSYLTRNEFLGHQWIENPNAVPRAAWPAYLDAAQTTGPDTVFRILQALTNVPVSWFEVE